MKAFGICHTVEDPEALRRLRKDLREAAVNLSPAEVRYLVSTYYRMQDNRVRADNQRRAIGESNEPHAVLDWLSEASHELEGVIPTALGVYARQQPLGRWALAQKGIGPVLAAGLLAHIDLDRATTAGGVWRFAGLDPTAKWERGKKRPHNAALKTLCWKIGESFVKVSGRDNAFYGCLYKERKTYEQKRNEAGELAEQAAAVLKRCPTHAQAAIYRKGKLPDGHIHARAKRWAVKMFLAHYFEVGCRLAGRTPPTPYAVAHGGHAHYIAPPGPLV